MGKITVDAATAEAIKAGLNGGELTEVYGPDGALLVGAVPANVIREVRRMLDERRRAIDEALAAWAAEGRDAQTFEAEIAAGGGIPHEEAMKRWGFE